MLLCCVCICECSYCAVLYWTHSRRRRRQRQRALRCNTSMRAHWKCAQYGVQWRASLWCVWLLRAAAYPNAPHARHAQVEKVSRAPRRTLRETAACHLVSAESAVCAMQRRICAQIAWCSQQRSIRRRSDGRKMRTHRCVCVAEFFFAVRVFCCVYFFAFWIKLIRNHIIWP